jgi:hypothetical protein
MNHTCAKHAPVVNDLHGHGLHVENIAYWRTRSQEGLFPRHAVPRSGCASEMTWDKFSKEVRQGLSGVHRSMDIAEGRKSTTGNGRSICGNAHVQKCVMRE